jgi:hypothetical protein
MPWLTVDEVPCFEGVEEGVEDQGVEEGVEERTAAGVDTGRQEEPREFPREDAQREGGGPDSLPWAGPEMSIAYHEGFALQAGKTKFVPEGVP